MDGVWTTLSNVGPLVSAKRNKTQMPSRAVKKGSNRRRSSFGTARKPARWLFPLLAGGAYETEFGRVPPSREMRGRTKGTSLYIGCHEGFWQAWSPGNRRQSRHTTPFAKVYTTALLALSGDADGFVRA